MTKTSLPVSAIMSSKSPSKTAGGMECFWFEDDGFILDVDCFVKTIATIKAKGASPDHIGSIIAHYASTWLPDLSGVRATNSDETYQQQQSDSVTAYVMKKRFLVEILTGIIPPERDSVSCNFLLRLLRTANMVGVDPNYKAELEMRISWQLEQASLTELMIPSFSHTCGKLFDVELVTRLVKKFTRLNNEGFKSGASLIKVAKLVDSYLAEAAVDSGLSLAEFISLAEALPNHSRVTEDGLYRALDTYLKAHPNVTKQERRRLCGLIGIKKLSMEASLHAAKNHRLPVRTIIQILFTEQTKLSNRHNNNNNIDSTGSSLSRNPSGSHFSEPSPGWCMSKRDMNVQQAEIRRLRVGMEKLQSECEAMQKELEKEKKGGSTSTGNTGRRKWYYRWKKFRLRKGFSSNFVDKKTNGVGEEEFEYEHQKPCKIKKLLVKGRKHNLESSLRAPTSVKLFLADTNPSFGQVDNTEEPTALIIPDQPMEESGREELKKAMKQFTEQLIEDDTKISTASSSALKIVDEATNPQDQNLPNLGKFGLLTKTTRIKNHIHVRDGCDTCTLKSGGSNQPVKQYC